jgi:MFS family permease
VYLTSYGTAVLGLTGPTMLVLGVIGGGVLAGSVVVAARWSDRVGRRRVVQVGNLAAIVVGPVAFLVMELRHPVAVGIGLCAVLAIGGFGLGPAAAWLPELFAARYRYTAAGLAYSLAAILGGAIPPIIATTLAASYGGLAVGVLLAGYGLLGLACGRALPEPGAISLLPRAAAAPA